MPRTLVVFFKEEDGSVPLLDWLDDLEDKAKDKCVVKIERLAELGHALRRPEADVLRDGIYELRTHRGTVQYRTLYFFHGTQAVVISHGIAKEDQIPSREIDLALARKAKYLKNPEKHTHEE
jgi:phage-related protein